MRVLLNRRRPLAWSTGAFIAAACFQAALIFGALSQKVIDYARSNPSDMYILYASILFLSIINMYIVAKITKTIWVLLTVSSIEYNGGLLVIGRTTSILRNIECEKTNLELLYKGLVFQHKNGGRIFIPSECFQENDIENLLALSKNEI